MDWRLKAFAFRALELPGGSVAHYWLQRHVTRNWPRHPKALEALAEIAGRVVRDYQNSLDRIPETVLEVGAGRDLAVPLALRRLGVCEVITSDVKRLARLDLIQHAADHLIPHRAFSNWDDVVTFGIIYLAPHDLSEHDQRVDCSCSNEVLEHVPPDQLAGLLKVLRSLTRGITTHSIDYSDHYARSDHTISRLNFLRYSEVEWRKFNVGRHYVNRLRHSDYLRLFREAGFTILEESLIAAEPPAGLKVAAQFEKYEASDLFAIKGRIIAR